MKNPISESDLETITSRISEKAKTGGRRTQGEINEKLKLERIQQKVKEKAKPPIIDKLLDSEIRLDLKPLSVNEAFQGRRFKSPKYNVYTKNVLCLLPKFEMPPKPYKVSYEFGFSTRNSDLGNPEKPLTDILCKFYGFDDRDIYEFSMKKVIVKKGEEYAKIRIESL